MGVVGADPGVHGNILDRIVQLGGGDQNWKG